MAVSTGSYMQGFHNQAQANGAKLIASDFTMQIAGWESMYLLIKNQFWPVLTGGEGIEVPTVLGAANWQVSQVKFHQQSPISLEETVLGSVDRMLLDLLSKGGEFDATLFHGTPRAYTQAKRIHKCSLQIDTPETDWESRTQILLLNGQCFYHYFGEIIPGNVQNLQGSAGQV